MILINTINLKLGKYDTYKELCSALDEPYINGTNSTNSNLKKWSDYIEVKK